MDARCILGFLIALSLSFFVLVRSVSWRRFALIKRFLEFCLTVPGLQETKLVQLRTITFRGAVTWMTESSLFASYCVSAAGSVNDRGTGQSTWLLIVMCLKLERRCEMNIRFVAVCCNFLSYLSVRRLVKGNSRRQGGKLTTGVEHGFEICIQVTVHLMFPLSLFLSFFLICTITPFYRGPL